MRENRPSGSEGGVAFGPSLPLSGQEANLRRVCKARSSGTAKPLPDEPPGAGKPFPRSAGVLTRSMRNDPRRLCNPLPVTVPTRCG